MLEDLRLPARQPARREQTEGRLTGWFHGLLGRCIQDKAQERGIPLVAVHPAFTSLNCSRCGARGRRRRHGFVCPGCGHAEHADVNAARNIRNAAGNLGAAAGSLGNTARNLRNAAPAQDGRRKTGLNLSDLSRHDQLRLARRGGLRQPALKPRVPFPGGRASAGKRPLEPNRCSRSLLTRPPLTWTNPAMG